MAAKGEGVEEGRIRSLGLGDANYCTQDGGFPGGSVLKNLPANAGDTGSILGPGESHMLRSSEVCAPQLLNLCPRARAPQQEKPLQ